MTNPVTEGPSGQQHMTREAIEATAARLDRIADGKESSLDQDWLTWSGIISKQLRYLLRMQ